MKPTASLRIDFVAMATGLFGVFFASTAMGQWTATSLHPAGATFSRAYGTAGSQQVGVVRFGGVDRAALWSGTASTWVDLHAFLPVGFASSEARGVSIDGVQVRVVGVGINTGGGASSILWTSTALNTWTASVLDPSGSTRSECFAASGGQQSGTARIGGIFHAGYWNGSAATWVDLHPLGSVESNALAISGTQQAGLARIGNVDRASVWNGTPGSWVDLNPAGSTESAAWGVSDGQQVGFARIGLTFHASLWFGTSASWVDLNPPGSTFSMAYATHNGQQVGLSQTSSDFHATLWSGTPNSWVDLHSYLPLGFFRSEARGVSSDGLRTWIAGFGGNELANREEALLWTRLTCTTPAMLSQPVSQTSAPGSVALFEVEVAASGTVTYQWRRGGGNLSDGGRIAGATTPVLSISNVQSSDQGTYDCVVIDACNSLQSDSVQLSCQAAFIGHPNGGTFNAGRSIVLSASHAPAGSVTYRWKKDGSNLFNSGSFSGVTTPTLTINTTDPSQTGSYTLSVTNVCGIAVSNAAIVEVVCGSDLDDGSGMGNPDGGIDITDLLYFLGAFESGSPAADLDNGTGNGIPDGGVDINDLLYFLLHFEAGC